MALEDNGHVYAYILNADSSVVQIADIDSKLGGAMGLDYDTYEKKLWVAADNGFGNMSATIRLNGTTEPVITHVKPAAGLDITANNEGFAIASAEYTVNGQRPVYHFNDGVKSGALTISFLACDYTEDTDKIPDEDPTEPVNPTEPANPMEPANPVEPVNPTEPTGPAESVNPTEPAGPTDQKEPVLKNDSVKVDSTTTNTTTPKTGDESLIALFVMVLIVSGGLAGTMMYIKRKTDR